MIDSCTYIYIKVSVWDITLECLQTTPTKFRGSKFPGNIHNYIWCPYYLPSFMKYCSVVSEELCWQKCKLLQKYISGNFLIQRGITPTKFRGSKFPGNMHNYIWCPYYLPSFMNFCSGVSEELRWQTVWRTDRQDKNNMSPQQSGGRHKYYLNTILKEWMAKHGTGFIFSLKSSFPILCWKIHIFTLIIGLCSQFFLIQIFISH